MSFLLLLGALAAIANLLLGVYNTYLAMKRTNLQTELHSWKKEAYKRKKNDIK